MDIVTIETEKIVKINGETIDFDEVFKLQTDDLTALHNAQGTIERQNALIATFTANTEKRKSQMASAYAYDKTIVPQNITDLFNLA